MNKTNFKTMSIIIFSLVLFLGMTISNTFSVKALGNIYYVDSINGNDSNNGTSTSTAWKTFTKVNSTTFKPGDQILLKSDCSWNEMLNPKGSGDKGNPIIIDMYGTGSKPIINGNGIEFPNAPIKLSNQSYFEIKNIEITNDASSNGNRAGVLIRSDNKTINNSIHLSNLYIHNVKGDLSNTSGKLTGGIIIDSFGALGTKYDDILIQNCSIKTCDGSGINVGFIDDSANANSDYYNTNVIVKNNTIDDISGDGILIYHSSAPVVEYNMISNNNSKPYNNVASNNEKQFNTGYSSAIYSWSCNEALIQYNEIYGENIKSESQEGGTAFNLAGYNHNNVIQYNYSHDNKGGFIAIGGQTGDASNGSIIRYNISQNDNHNTFDFYGASKDTFIYNNTIYIKSDMNVNIYNFRSNDSLKDTETKWHENCYNYNNIYYNLGSGDYILGSSIKTIFDYNVFYGNHPANEPKDDHKLTTDPLLMGAGSATNGLDSTYGYKLNKTSPCVNSGIDISTIISNNSDTKKDYFGNALKDAPDRGANEFTADLSKLPAAPKNLSVLPASPTQINLSWDAVSGATSYELSVDGTIISNVASPYYNRDLEEGSTHSYKIRSINADGKSAWSDEVIGSTKSPLPNLIPNPGFENGYKYWNINYGSALLSNDNAHKGTYAMRIGSATGGIGQIITEDVYPNRSYTFSALGKVNSSTSNCFVGIDCLNAAGNVIKRSVSELNFSSTKYEEKSDSFTTPAGTSKLKVYIYNDNGYVYADDIKLTLN